MSRGVNKAVIVGTLGKDPEVRYATNGNVIVHISVATKENWKDRQTGEAQQRTEWHRIVIFGKPTGRYIGEGFDDARLDTLFLSLPVSWKGTLVQYAGRLHRLHPGKHEVRIVDYVDSQVPMLSRMFERRLRGYRAMGYSEDNVN